MCQLTPFTLPCCRRTYVAVLKMPSCPDNWPKSKCPPELCIQVYYEPDHRDAGICWRCKADDSGVSDQQREQLRPGIDRADVVIGLDETNPPERRRETEESGHCWFCGSRENCETFAGPATVKIEAPREEHHLPSSRKRNGADMDDRPVNKRLLVEGRTSRCRASKPAASLRQEAHWQAQVPHDLDGESLGGPSNYAQTMNDHQPFQQSSNPTFPLSHWNDSQYERQPEAIDPRLLDVKQSPTKPEEQSNFDLYNYPDVSGHSEHNQGWDSQGKDFRRENENDPVDNDCILLGEMLDSFNKSNTYNDVSLGTQNYNGNNPTHEYTYPNPETQ